MRLRAWAPLPLLHWPEAALIPFVNMALLLLGLMTLGPALSTPTGMPLQLPRAVTAEALGGAGVVMTVTEQRLIYLNGQLITLEELSQHLAPLLAVSGPATTVLIKADQRVPIDTLTRVWDTCRQLGVARVAVATTKALE